MRGQCARIRQQLTTPSTTSCRGRWRELHHVQLATGPQAAPTHPPPIPATATLSLFNPSTSILPDCLPADILGWFLYYLRQCISRRFGWVHRRNRHRARLDKPPNHVILGLSHVSMSGNNTRLLARLHAIAYRLLYILRLPHFCVSTSHCAPHTSPSNQHPTNMDRTVPSLPLIRFKPPKAVHRTRPLST